MENSIDKSISLTMGALMLAVFMETMSGMFQQDQNQTGGVMTTVYEEYQWWQLEIQEIASALLASRTRTATLDGNATGSTLIDGTLAGKPVNSFVGMLAVVNPANIDKIHSATITAYNPVNGELQLSSPAPAGKIEKGTFFKILTLKFSVAGIDTLLANTSVLLAGKARIIEKKITSPANAGVITLATVLAHPCIIEELIIHADSAQTVDMTSCAVSGGAGSVITFIDNTDAIQANLDAEDKQIGWTGAVRLATGKTITMNLIGTGATPISLTVSVRYRACEDGGLLS
jgi:hypothetical protein